MEAEILNIEYHIRILCLKALNKAQNHDDASSLLGITPRSLYRYKKRFGIIYDKEVAQFQLRAAKVKILNTTHKKLN